VVAAFQSVGVGVMTVADGLAIAGSAAGLAFVLVGATRRYALRHQMLDHPGSRSSHARPTPRGGGLGLVAAVSFTLVAASRREIDAALVVALLGVVLTALLGWLDDRHSLGVRVRLVAHIVAGLSLLPLALSTPSGSLWLAAVTALWWVFWTVSAINVVNFMDGIDGLIGSQALIFGAYLAFVASSGGVAQVSGLALAGASAGFLVWNWPPAKIFLGDVGSGALGLLFVLGGILLLRGGRVTLVEAYLPLYAIFLDATTTLVRRVRRGERLTEAHRSHLYQRLANGGWGHARVTLLYAGVALAALPIAFLPASSRNLGIAAYFIGVLGLGVALDRRATRPRA
jgi:Fuc2NAc and GlcNAc transferase